MNGNMLNIMMLNIIIRKLILYKPIPNLFHKSATWWRQSENRNLRQPVLDAKYNGPNFMISSSYEDKYFYYGGIMGHLLFTRVMTQKREISGFQIFWINILAELAYLIILCLFSLIKTLLRPPLLGFEVRDDVIFSQSEHDCPVILCPVIPQTHCIQYFKRKRKYKQ